jgi:ABC-type antimicrobial peptide transport system ATPase subunit
VRRVCGEVVKLVNQVNLTLGHGRKEGELTGAEGESGGADLIELGGGVRGG